MPGETVVKGSQPLEYTPESTFASAEPDSTTWSWVGLIDSWSATEGVESESVRYLPEDGATDKLENRQNVKVSETWEADLTYAPQDFDLLQYYTGTDTATSDTLTPLQFGEQDEDNGEYRRLLGGVGEEFTFSVSEDEVAEVSASFMFADGENWTSTDYVVTANGGAHATEDTSSPFSYGDLGNVTLGGSALGDSLESLELSVSNELEIVKDPDSSRNSHIEAIVPTSREITVELGLTYSNFDMAQTVRNYTSQTLSFDVGGYTFTVDGVRFPEFPYELSPEDLVGDSVSSDPCTDLTWTAP